MDKNSGHIGLKFACGFCNNSGLKTYVSKYREVKFLIFSLKEFRWDYTSAIFRCLFADVI